MSLPLAPSQKIIVYGLLVFKDWFVDLSVTKDVQRVYDSVGR